MYYSEFLLAIVIASLAIDYVMTKAVFAHYLVYMHSIFYVAMVDLMPEC